MDYYVSTTGDDGNPGTLNSPFRTIQRCLDIVGPGDFCVIRGGVYSEALTLSASGDAAHPITIRDFTGEAVTVDSGGSRTLSVSGRLGYYTIEGLSFLTSGAGGQTDGNLDFKGGVWAGETAKEGGNDGFILRDCYVQGAIKFYGHHNLVEGCEVDGMNGAWATGIFEQYGASHHNTYRANSIHGFSGRGIWSMSYTENILVEKNRVFDCSTMGIDLDGASHPVRHGVLRDNTIHGIIGAQGVGILLENGFDCVIERNLIHDVGHEGIQVFNYGQGCGHAADGEYRDDHTSTVLKNNVIYNVYGGDKGAINGYSIRGIYVYGNTMYNVRGAGILLNEHCGWQCQDWEIKNNSFVECDQTIKINGAAGPLDITNNLYWASSVQTGGDDVVNADPLFVAPSAGDFHLQPTSPAIDTGAVIVDLLDDLDGNPRPLGAGYDIGAYEYAGEIEDKEMAELHDGESHTFSDLALGTYELIAGIPAGWSLSSVESAYPHTDIPDGVQFDITAGSLPQFLFRFVRGSAVTVSVATEPPGDPQGFELTLVQV